MLRSMQEIQGNLAEQIEKLESHNEKVEKMEVIGKWNMMARAMLLKHNKLKAKQAKIQRMVILGNWNILTRRMVDAHVKA